MAPKMTVATPVRLLNLGLAEPWRTQAIYHAVAETMTSETPDTLVVCRPASPYLCLGYHQVFDRVLDREECERRSLPVYRRRVGGGLTYLDENQLFYQCIFHESRAPSLSKDVYALMLEAPVSTLQSLGLDAALRFENEIEVGSRRIAGIGGARIGEAAVVVGNLLLDFDFEILPRLWRVPSEGFRDRGAAALRERLVTMRELLEWVSPDAILEILLESFARALKRPLRVGELTPEEERCSHEVRERMASPVYLNLHREEGNGPVVPMMSLKISARAWIQAEAGGL
jgi:lipoate-protein ligase A